MLLNKTNDKKIIKVIIKVIIKMIKMISTIQPSYNKCSVSSSSSSVLLLIVLWVAGVT